MSVTSKLKRGVDIPVFEWLRPLPVSTATLSALTGEGKPYGRYLYYQYANNAGFFRYDTYSDSWNQLTNSAQSFTTLGQTTYNDKHGYYGRVIESISSTQIRMAAPTGNKCVGKRIKILSGTGAGQSRTITAVSEPTVHDTIVYTSGSSIAFTDSNKNYTRNQWRDYMLRVVGNNQTDFRKILFNSNNTIAFADARFSSYGVQWAYAPLPYTPAATSGSNTIAQIESHIVTIDSAWTVNPDNTSVFVVESGGLWSVNVSIARWGFQYYDIMCDTWYVKNSASGGYLTTNLGTDVAFDTLCQSGAGILLSGTASSATSRTLVDSSLSLTADQYANYIIRIKAGTGVGQEAAIVSHTTNTFTVFKDWSITPDNTSQYEILVDNDKQFMLGAGGSAMFEYDAYHDVWSDRRILDASTVNNLAAIWVGYNKPITISTITRTGTLATVTTLNPHGIKDGETVTIVGASDALYNISAVITVTGDNTFTYTMAGTPAANAVAAFSTSATLLVDASKNWQTNELVGKVVSFLGGPSQTSLNQGYFHRVITANTATTITFASNTTASQGGLYFISDRSHLGAIGSDTVGAGATSSVIPLASTTYTANILAGKRVVVIDNNNWGEGSITSNTTNSITLSAVLPFTPSTNAVISILGNFPTGQGCQLQHLYNTSQLQKGRYMFSLRGNTTNNMLRYDISSNQWFVLGQVPNLETFTAGTTCSYDGDDRIYIQQNNFGRITYYSFTDNLVYSAGTVPFGMSNATFGNKLPILKTEDGLKFVYVPRHNAQEFWRLMLWT